MFIYIAIMVFTAVFFSTIAVYMVFRTSVGAQNRNIKRRLDDLSLNSGGESILGVGSIMRDTKFSRIPAVNRILTRFTVSQKLQKLIMQSGVSINTGTLVLGMLSLGGLAFLLIMQFLNNVLFALLGGFIAGSLPYLYLQRRKRKRKDDFEALLPEALDMITNALKCGFSFESSMKMVAQEIPDPVGIEFAITFEEQNLGANIGDAFANLRNRIASDDLDLFITALMIHKKTGGNLSEVLEKTAATIRERFKLKREIKTKTAHGRFSGFILVLLPLIMVAIILTLNPDYFMVLIKEKTGNYILGTAIVLQILGIWLIKRIVDIKI